MKCATHGKNRTMKNLEKNDDEEWVCRADSQCRQPPAGESENNDEETAKCSLHGKVRTVSNLGKDNNGEWVCLGSSLCKGAGNGGFGNFDYPQNSGWLSSNAMYGGGPFCTVHGKNRTQRNLVRNNLGEWVCAPGMQCKGGIVGQEFTTNGNAIKVCSVHGKARSAQNMEKTEDGEWKCTEKYTCKVVPKGAKDSEEQICSIHNKSRSSPNLEQNEDGEWVCINGSQCK